MNKYTRLPSAVKEVPRILLVPEPDSRLGFSGTNNSKN